MAGGGSLSTLMPPPKTSADGQVRPPRRRTALRQALYPATGLADARDERCERLKLLKGAGSADATKSTGIDRLARSTLDLFTIVKQIVDARVQVRRVVERGRNIRQCEHADNRRSQRHWGRGTQPRRTCAAGARADRRGRQHMGRPPRLTPRQQKEARRRSAGRTGDIARSFNVKHSTFRGQNHDLGC